MPAPAYLQQSAPGRKPSLVHGQRSGQARRRPHTQGASAQGGIAWRALPGRIAAWTFTAVLATTLYIGWRESEEGHLSPDTGIGYWLGITGAAAMVLLLFYPLRKRMKSLRGFGSVSSWFRLHMVLGLVGPALILFHCNFRFGALNSNVALIAMLTVSASGLVGRYLYSRIHLGLYGRRARIDDLVSDIRQLQNSIAVEHSLPEPVLSRLEVHVARAITQHGGVVSSLAGLLGHRLRSPRKRLQLRNDFERYIALESRNYARSWRTRRRRARKLRRLLRRLLALVDKAAAFAFYERLFALWHVLHLPLFILLILAGIVHIIGVHLY